jgi:enterochelin esterase family protein
MKRLSVIWTLFVSALASAQDMPLHQIIIPGEAWKIAEGDLPSAPKITLPDLPLKQPAAWTMGLDGSTLLVADAADRYVWAFRIEKDGKLGPGDRYCRMRVRGDERRKRFAPSEAASADPSAMTTDAANRTYVATNLGIQVFDPTGRLCGVFTSPPGRIKELVFNGDWLFARTEGKVYVRKMVATGP